MEGAKDQGSAANGPISAPDNDAKDDKRFVKGDNRRYTRLVDRAQRFASPSLHHKKNSHGGKSTFDAHAALNLVFPSFGNLQEYGISLKGQEGFWSMGIKRLAKIVDEDKADMLLSEKNADIDKYLRSGLDSAAFEALALRADNILDALHVCIIDDQGLLKTRRASNKATRSHGALEQNWNKQTKLINLPGVWIKSEPMSFRHTFGNSGKVENQSSRSRATVDGSTISSEKTTDSSDAKDLSYLLVDQIAETLAIVACRGRQSNYWHAVVLACLAMLSTKLKVLLTDLPKNIQDCLGRNPISRFKVNEDEEEEEPLDANSPTETRYCTEFDNVSSWLTECFIHALRGLGAQKPWWNTDNHLDICTMIYAAGVSGTRTLVCQDRRGEISGSSANLPVSFSSKALGLVGEISVLLGQQAKSSPSSVSLEVELQQSDGKCVNPDMTSLEIHSVKELIITATALSLSNPSIGKQFQDSLHVISALPVFGTSDDIGDDPSKNGASAFEDPIYAFVSLGSRQAGDLVRTPSRLSSSYLAAMRHNVLSRQAPRPDTLHHPPSPSDVKRTLAEAKAHRRNLEAAVKRWNVAETSITIDCPNYVYSVLLFSGTLVIGGLCCGFSVGERIPGVDPFNLTMFSWIIGGFVILIVKSVRVSEWPWRDFLLRQVTCRTVREVATVSGLDPQDILTFLLAFEHRSQLKMRGPFRGMFYRDGDPGGFSVDVRPSLQTLLASGIIPVTVGTLEGPAVQFIRLIPGFERCVAIGLSGKTSSGDVICRDPPQQEERCDAILVTEELRWIKVLGLYNATGARF